MKLLTLFCSTLLFAAVSQAPALAADTAKKEFEYKRADTNFYWRGDVLKAMPNAVIVPAGGFTEKDGSYFTPAKGKKAPKTIFVQVMNDWIEPITPPTMPTTLGVPSDAIQVREPQGDVQVAFPNAPATFLPVTDGMTLANGAVLKTGANGSVAVLFGGMASARLTPNSQAAVQQNLNGDTRAVEVDLTTGAVFSKVGKRIGEKEDYSIHTEKAIAAARGTDFVTVALPARTDVWIAQGTVQLDQTDGKLVGTVSSEGGGALKIIRFPLMPNAHDAMMASAETMTEAMNFIPLANLKVKALLDRQAKGETLSPAELKYLSLIKKVPCLIRLDYVEPPAPPAPAPPPAPAVVTPPPAPSTSAPAPEAAAPAAAATPAPAKVEETTTEKVLRLRVDGKVKFGKGAYTFEELEPKVKDYAKAHPDQTLTLKGGKDVPYEYVKAVMDICKNSGVKNVKVDAVNSTPPPPPAPAANSAAAPAKPEAAASETKAPAATEVKKEPKPKKKKTKPAPAATPAVPADAAPLPKETGEAPKPAPATPAAPVTPVPPETPTTTIP